MPIQRSRRPLVLLAILAMVFASVVATFATAPPASASHGRANQLNWHKGAGPTEVEFHLTGSWRCTYFFNPCAPAVGQQFPYSNGFLDFGDGTSENAEFEVVSYDPVNDVVSGEAHITHTYPANGPYTAAISDCCRLGSVQWAHEQR